MSRKPIPAKTSSPTDQGRHCTHRSPLRRGFSSLPPAFSTPIPSHIGTENAPCPALAALGRRIMVTGPTNAGKSTLADALARKLGVPPIHLDRFSHLPGTDWQPRDTGEFHALHDAAILADAWVMDGNYSAIMPQRYARATGVIVIDDHFLRRYLRYFRRTLFQPNRIGGLHGGRTASNGR